jgi:methionyl-tRNA formyltransferase
MIKTISIIISSSDHPINPIVEEWVRLKKREVDIEIVRSPKDLPGGDLLFLISCNEIVSVEILKKYKKSLVIHASDLPEGRGFSPHIWDILNGRDILFISLLEASKKVDTGDIWKKLKRRIPKYFLYEDILNVVNCAHIELMDFALANFDTVSPKPQSKEVEATYHSKRTPEDSRLDVHKSINEQFNLLRVCDKNRFPAFFVIHGKKYKVIVENYEN